MYKEPLKIMFRRFSGRILESGLLIIAVALGTGAVSSGIALLLQTDRYNIEMSSSPEYRELVVSTVDNLKEMEQAAVETLITDSIRLQPGDLAAAEIIPQISYAYIRVLTQMGFLNEEMINEKGGMEKLEQYRPKEGDDESRRFFAMVDAFKSAKDNPDFIIPGIKELFGYSVSPQFFDAWGIEAGIGSLFSTADMTSVKNIVVLGTDTALLLAGENPAEELIGKKIISFDKFYTIVGIMNRTGRDYDKFYFTPYRENRTADSRLQFTVSDPEDLNGAALLLKEWFESKYGVGQVVLSNPRAEAEAIKSRNKGITLLILFLSLSGFFIALVNVANILFSRNIKMKKHAGILKAMGASRLEILRLISLEALSIVVIGTVFGTALALPLAGLMERALDLGTGSFLNMLPGVFFSFILTSIFAIIPSWQNFGTEAAEDMR